MKEYMVGFLVLLAVAGFGVAQKKPPGQERLFEAHPTDCSAYYERQLRQCPRGQLFNIEEQQCDSPGNVNCDCKGEGNTCERSPGEDKNDEQHGHGGDDHGGQKGDSKENGGKDSKNNDSKEDKDHGNGGDKSSENDNDHKHDNDNSNSEEKHENDSKGDSHEDDDTHKDREKSVCKKLERSQHGKWTPRHCSKKAQKLGRVCKLECSRGFNRSGGSQVRCMESGWEGEYGVNIIPTCMSGGTTSGGNEQTSESPTTTTMEEIGDEFMKILNNTDGDFEQVLFIVDSSQNVGETTFYRTELNFVKVITEVLFSRLSFFGLTTYNVDADVVIPLDEYQSSGFIQRVDNLQYSPRDGSDMANVLDRSFSDIRRSRRKTLVVLISGTESSTDGSGEARLIQSQGNIIIPVVVGEVNRHTAISISSVNEEGTSLYFLFQSWEIFSSTTTYISQRSRTATGITGTTQPTSEDNPGSGTATGITGTTQPTSEDNSDGVEEISEEFLNILNNTEEGYEQVLFIVDSSQNVGENTFYGTELNFIKVITQVLFSKVPSFGLTTYNDNADVVIPLAEYGSSGFIQRVDDIQYSPREGSDVANVLDCSFLDIRRSRRRTLIVLISGTESSTDGSGEARLIQSRGNIIIPVVVGEVNRNPATSISSTSEEGRSLYFLFKSWESFSSTIIYISENYGTTTTPDYTGMSKSTEDTTSNSERTTGNTDATVPTSEITSGGGTTSGENPQSTGSPTTSTAKEISVEFMNILNNTDGGFEQVLFIVDSSQNVGETTFSLTELNFVKVITKVLFSRFSYFGLTTYNDHADVVIPLDEYQSSEFIQRVDDVQYSPRDGSDMANVLDRTFLDIRRSGRRTLVLLISGTESSTDGSGEARLIQTRGNIIIPVVVGEVNHNTAIAISSVNEEGTSLYFVFQSWESFSSTTTYISQNYKTGDTSTTPPTLDETSHYTTTSDDMSQSTGDVTSGSDETTDITGTTQQTSEGTSAGVEEIGDEFLNILNNTVGGFEQVLFIVDSSQNVGETTFYRTELNFIKVITEVLFSKISYFGLTTYNYIADVVIPLAEYQSSGFIQRVDDVQYSPREGSDMANVLDRSFSDIRRSRRRTLVVLISGTESSTDGSGEARLIQSRGNIIIPVVVGEVNLNTAISISSTSEEGRSLYFLFKSWESFSSTIIYIKKSYGTVDGNTSATQPTSEETSSYEITSPGTTGTNPPTSETISACDALESVENGHWDTSTCSEESSSEGTVCQLVCESGFDLSGDAEMTCTKSGWGSSDGDNQLPACMTLEERSSELVERLNHSLHDTSNVLIVLDESWSVGQDHFTNIQLAFFNTLLNFIWLTTHSIGVVTYSDTASVVISLGEYQRSVLQDRMNSISYKQGGVSNIEKALEVVSSEMQQSEVTGSTLILLVSTSNSSTDGSSQARRINDNGGVIFPLVVGSDYNRLLHISSVTEREERTFFKFTSWESFSSILSFINETYIPDSPEVHVCEALENSQRGHWEASNCSSGTSELGTVCELVCEEGYELSGTPEVTCNQSGWESYGGGRNMPSCKTIEEIGEDFIANINMTLGRPANLMFVVDGSGSLTEEEFGLETGLVNAIVRAFPLSEDRSAGVVTFSSDATVDVSISSNDTCTFLSDVSAIRYRRGGTNLALALQLANNELEQNAVHDFTVTFLITDGISTTDPTEPAAILKRGDNPLFAIGVGDYDAEQLTSIATYFYPIRDFGIFNSLKDVLETDYASRTNVQC